MPSARIFWALRFTAGLLLLVAGGAGMLTSALRAFELRTYPLEDVALGVVGFWLALTSVRPLVRSLLQDLRLRRDWGKDAFAEFARAGTAQRVFLLLLSIAEADGHADARERELVRAFVLRRFPAAGRDSELDRWAKHAQVPRNLEALAQSLGGSLDRGDGATLYSWCCLVAFADGPADARELAALQRVARGLGLEPAHAMFLFEFAQRAARERRVPPGARSSNGGAPPRGDRGTGSGAGPPPRPDYGTPREQALAVLGLPHDATAEMVRKRHRELVRRFHPDAHGRLGPIAQQEATERFLLIQRAYETLRA